MAEQLIEPYNGDQSQDAELEFRVAGTDAGDCVLAMTVSPGAIWWETRLNNDGADEIRHLYNGTTDTFTLSTNQTATFYGSVTLPGIRFTSGTAAGTNTAILGTVAPGATLTPNWLKVTWGTFDAYLPVWKA